MAILSLHCPFFSVKTRNRGKSRKRYISGCNERIFIVVDEIGSEFLRLFVL